MKYIITVADEKKESVLTVQGGHITIFDREDQEDSTLVAKLIVTIIATSPFASVLGHTSPEKLIDMLFNGGGITMSERRLNGKRLVIRARVLEERVFGVHSHSTNDEVVLIDADGSETLTRAEFDTVVENAPEGMIELVSAAQPNICQEVGFFDDDHELLRGHRVIQEATLATYRVNEPSESVDVEEVINRMSAAIAGVEGKNDAGFTKYRHAKVSRPFDVPGFPEKLEPLPNLPKKESELDMSLSNEELQELKDLGAKLIVVVAPSGSGKTTLVREVFSTAETLVSFTTRDPRPGEIHGRDYYFITDEEVDAIRESGDLVEYVEYNGHRYGYTKSEVMSKFRESTEVACVATIEGFFHFKEVLGDIVKGVYLNTPREIVARHLANRNDDAEKIQERLSFYENEAKNRDFFAQRKDSLEITLTDDFLENVSLFRGVVDAALALNLK